MLVWGDLHRASRCLRTVVWCVFEAHPVVLFSICSRTAFSLEMHTIFWAGEPDETCPAQDIRETLPEYAKMSPMSVHRGQFWNSPAAGSNSPVNSASSFIVGCGVHKRARPVCTAHKTTGHACALSACSFFKLSRVISASSRSVLVELAW